MLIQSLFLHPLGPALVLALGALLMSLGHRLAIGRVFRPSAYASRREALGRFEPTLSRLGVLSGIAFVALAAAVLVLGRGPAGRPILRWSWQPLTVAGSFLEWQTDGWNWLIAGVILLLAAVAILLSTGDPARALHRSNDADLLRAPHLERWGTDVRKTLWLAAAALVFVCSGTLVTLASSWVLLDAALALRLRPESAPQPANRAWGMLSLAGFVPLLVLLLLHESGIKSSLTGGPFKGTVLALLWLAALIRAGIYPLHFWLSGPGKVHRSGQMAFSLIVPLTGLWLLARVGGVAVPDWLRRPEWMALAVLALFGTALVAWLAEGEEARGRWIALNRASLVLMAAHVAGSQGPEALTWAVISFGLGCALLSVAQAAREQLGWRLPIWLAVLAVWGLPGTPGFLARTVLVYPTGFRLAIPLFGIVLLAEILLAAALWEEARHGWAGRSPAARAGWSVSLQLGLAMVLLLAPIAMGGLMPPRLAALVGWPIGEPFSPLGWWLIHARRSVWAGLVLSALLGIGLGVFRTRIFSQVRGWQQGVAAFVSLEWLYQAVILGLGLAANGLQYFAALGEGEGYLGWLALAGLILWVLLRG